MGECGSELRKLPGLRLKSMATQGTASPGKDSWDSGGSHPQKSAEYAVNSWQRPSRMPGTWNLYQRTGLGPQRTELCSEAPLLPNTAIPMVRNTAPQQSHPHSTRFTSSSTQTLLKSTTPSLHRQKPTHSFTKYWLRTCYLPGPLPGMWDTSVAKQDQGPAPCEGFHSNRDINSEKST